MQIQRGLLATLLLLVVVSLASAQTSNRLNLRPQNRQQQQQQRTRNDTATVRNAATTATNATQFARLSNNEFVEDELPADFYEMPAEQLDLGANATGRAPTPILRVAVLQNGQEISSEINVHPGTPLEMLIQLDDKSSKVYGLLASHLRVKDDTPRQREEIIIHNGCSLDTYIFGNFEHSPEDQSLRAKFRAFKFPDSNFLRFEGTVNVCIKQCAKVNCGAGGRRRKRSAPSATNNQLDAQQRSTKSQLVSLTVSTVLRVGY